MWLIQKLKGKMDPPEPKSSQLNNNNSNSNSQPQQQHHPDSLLHSDPSINIDKIAQSIAKDLETLVLSCKHGAIDQVQHTQNHSVVIDNENQVKQQADDDLRHLAVKEDVNEPVEAESWREIEEVERRRLEKVLEADLKEFRVLEEQETVESEIGCEKDWDLSSEIGDYENNNVEYEGVQHLENERKSVGGDGCEGLVSVPNDGKSKGYHYPLRLDAEDCAYYIRTGMCKFGSNCKFNHPLQRRSQPAKETKRQKEENVEKRGQMECKPIKEMKKQKEENVEKRGQTECKYHTSSAGCKYGKACKFNHGREKTVKTPVVEYNFLGLPIRPGEKECPYYMRNGSCKYGPSCRFNHPDPTAVGGDDAPTTYGNDAPTTYGNDAPTTYGNDGPLPLQRAPQSNIPNMPPWSAPRTPDPPAAFVQIMYPATQNMPPPNPDWNGYQAPAPVPAHLYPSSEQGLPIPPAFFLKNPPSNSCNTNMYTHQQQPMSVPEYPERPGQPDCSYFMKTGVCKYRASCKFHHPQSRISRTLRDQYICAYFSRHGTCKYGKACKYDHPVNYHSNSNPAEGYDVSNGPGPLVHQSV